MILKWGSTADVIGSVGETSAVSLIHRWCLFISIMCNHCWACMNINGANFEFTASMSCLASTGESIHFFFRYYRNVWSRDYTDIYSFVTKEKNCCLLPTTFLARFVAVYKVLFTIFYTLKCWLGLQCRDWPLGSKPRGSQLERSLEEFNIIFFTWKNCMKMWSNRHCLRTYFLLVFNKQESRLWSMITSTEPTSRLQLISLTTITV